MIIPPRAKPSSCVGCACHAAGTDFAQPEGSGRLRVAIIGEASGEHEQRDQLPFRPYAPAGGILTRTIRRLGLDRSDFVISNLIRCRPYGNVLEDASYEHDAISHCQPNLLALLRQYKPKVLLACGSLPLKHLTGLAGEQRGVGHMRGYVLRALPQFEEAAGRDHETDPLLVVPTYHPAFLRRGAIHLTGVLARDIARSVNVAQGKDRQFILDLPDLAYIDYDREVEGFPADSREKELAAKTREELAAWLVKYKLRYQLHPTRRDLDLFCRDVKARSDAWLAKSADMREADYLCLSHDIETFESASLDEDATDGFTDTQVRLSQFSIEPGQGIALPWDKDGIAATRWLNKLPLPKCGHNCFAQNTSVWMADGTWKAIWKIREGEHVKSVKDGLLCKARVKGTLKTKDDRRWVSVSVDGAYNRGTGKWGNPGVICTPDHQWFKLLWNGDVHKVEARRLTEGDRVLLPRSGAFDLICGTLNGDGYCSPNGVLKTPHSNEGWAKAKAIAFGVKTHRYVAKGFAKSGDTYWDVQVYVPRMWRQLHYRGKQKVFVECSDRALAVFYGDDGCLAAKHRKNKIARIALHKFAPRERERARRWFQDRFGKCSLQSSSLAMSVDASKNFFARIAQYLHPSMEYKLPELYRGRYSGWMERQEPQVGWIMSVKPAVPKQYKQEDKYCITVEGTSAFFTRAGLTANCWLFDRKVLRAVGERDFGDRSYLDYAGTVHDTLQQFHFFQADLPAHLQFAASFTSFPFPWKHLSESCLEMYGCVDTDAALRVYRMTRKTMEDRRIWWDTVPGRQAAGYVAQVEMVRPILAKMEDRGVPVDDEKRLALGAEFETAEKEARKELDGRFPDEGRKIHSYKTVPDGVKAILEEISPTPLPAEDALGENGKSLTKTARRKLIRESLLARWTSVSANEAAIIRQRRFQDSPTKNYEGELEEGEWYFFDRRQVGVDGKKAAAGDLEATLRWCRVYEFSPNSSPQLLRYMEVKRHKIPTTKTGEKTTGKKELERLATRHGDDFYRKVIDCRELRKMRGTYIEGFRPHADGCVHTTFTFATSIGQLSSRNPNVQNWPKHGRLAKAARQMIAAKEGKILTEWDFKSCHVLTLGYLANDPNYIRLARIDMHSIMTGHFLKLWRVQNILSETDEELKKRCQWLKSVEKYKDTRDSKVKHAGLGIGNGLKAKGLFEKYMEFFSGIKEAATILDAYEEVFPKVFAWQRQTQLLAHRQTFLQTEFGYVRYYYEVFRWDSKRGDEWGHGDQGEEAISFWLSNIAFGHIREKMKELDRAGLGDRYGLCNNVHDSFLFHFDERLLDEHLRLVRPILQSPSLVLTGPAAPEGLWIGVDCSVGKNWGEMQEVKTGIAPPAVTSLVPV